MTFGFQYANSYTRVKEVGLECPTRSRYYTTGVFDDTNCSTGQYHAMLIVGYTANYWIVKNSWSQDFGDQGYVYYARGQNLCGMQESLIAVSN